MVSISDLSKGGKPEVEPDSALTLAQRATLRAEHERLAQIASVLSSSISTRLDVPQSRPHEIIVKASPAIAIMREEAAHARAAREQASRPWWKSWKCWSAILAGIGGCITFAIEVYPFVRGTLGL